MWPIVLGIGIGWLLVGFFGAVVVCSRMNEAGPPRGAVDAERGEPKPSRSRLA
jgi:hypothetical protein